MHRDERIARVYCVQEERKVRFPIVMRAKVRELRVRAITRTDIEGGRA